MVAHQTSVYLEQDIAPSWWTERPDHVDGAIIGKPGAIGNLWTTLVATRRRSYGAVVIT